MRLHGRAGNGQPFPVMSPMSRRSTLSRRELEDLAQLIFEWPIRQAPRLSLPFFILIAVGAQSLIMVLFSIDYKTSREPLPAPPGIYFLPEDTPATRQLAPWLEANDPGIFSPIHAARAALPAPPPLSYKPSYEDPPPPLRTLAVESEGISEPTVIPLSEPASGQRSARPKRPEEARPATHEEHVSTVARWEDDLAARTGKTATSNRDLFSPPYLPDTAVQPSLYEVEVGAEGIPLHALLLESSGSVGVDEAGRVWILSRRFEPDARSIWGRVRIEWGVAQATKPAQP